MKRLILINILLVLSLVVVNSQNWQIDINKAREIAAKENKPIILVFQGSDWCAPCMKLEKEIWSSDEFKQYAQEHYVLLKADFPRRKQNVLSSEQQEHNNKLAETYNKNGYFPYVVLLDKEGIAMGSTGYKGLSPAEYIKHLNSLIK